MEHSKDMYFVHSWNNPWTRNLCKCGISAMEYSMVVQAVHLQNTIKKLCNCRIFHGFGSGINHNFTKYATVEYLNISILKYSMVAQTQP